MNIQGITMSFPINLLSTEEIQAELKSRKQAEVLNWRNEILSRTEAINNLVLRIENLQGKATKHRTSGNYNQLK